MRRGYHKTSMSGTAENTLKGRFHIRFRKLVLFCFIARRCREGQDAGFEARARLRALRAGGGGPDA